MNAHLESWQRRLDYASLSDIGLRRTNNQDSMSVMVAGSPAAWQQRGDLFMVADGMGAHAAGELASKLATDTVPLTYQKLADRPPRDAVVNALQDANAKIHNRGQSNAEFKGMGTTCTTLLLLPQGAVVGHVGDSRAYRLRANRLEQLTFDHSLVWEMRATQGQVPDFIPKNVITRSLGPNPAVQVDVEGPLPILPGDTFLLCSDGLSGPVKDEEMGMILACLPPCDAVRALVDLANLRGGPDNITVVVARAVGDAWTQNAPAPVHLTAAVQPVAPWAWTVLGVLAAIGLGLLAMSQMLLGLAGLTIAAGWAGGVIYYRSGGQFVRHRTEGMRRGRGPYTATPVTPNAEFCGRLADIFRDLREAAKRQGWEVDWQRVRELEAQQAAAGKSGDYAQAVRHGCQAISFMMGELRRQGKGRPGQSN